MTWDMLADVDGWLWLVAIGIWLVSLVLSVVAGSWVVPWVLRRASRGDLPWLRYDRRVRPQAADPASNGDGVDGTDGSRGESTGTMNPDAMEVLRGGAWLGVLERLAITGSLLAGYPHGIAIIIAIKGLGRYPELRDKPVASERFVVGTLASLIWATTAGLIGLVAMRALVL